MGKKGKKAQAGKPKKLTPKEMGKRLDELVKKLEEELKGADFFAPMPPTEDCAICLLPLSRLQSKCAYHVYCGKVICCGCNGENDAIIKKQNGKKAKNQPVISDACPFCRAPRPSPEDGMRQFEMRAAQNDTDALFHVGNAYFEGGERAKDELKGLSYIFKSCELGHPSACFRVAACSMFGMSLPIDRERARLFFQVGALRGGILSREYIGRIEYSSGNYELGMRHWKIAAEAGSQASLDRLKEVYNNGDKEPGNAFIMKDDLDRIYRTCHKAQEEVKSEEREKHYAEKDTMKCKETVLRSRRWYLAWDGTGLTRGTSEGALLGPALGKAGGDSLGKAVGNSLGETLGTSDGPWLGAMLGISDWPWLGEAGEGASLGTADGLELGKRLGSADGLSINIMK